MTRITFEKEQKSKLSIFSYNVGDLVNVTCYSRGSSPPAELAWKVNDDKVLEEDISFGSTKDKLLAENISDFNLHLIFT